MMKFGTMQNQSVSTSSTTSMKSISEVEKLSNVYTNQSVRATAITLWPNAGIQNRHIMAISGHRSEQSLAHYNTRPSTSQLQRCSEVLSRSLTAESPFSSGTAINTHSQIQEQIEMTAATTSSSYVGSLFNNCTVQQAHVHVTFGSDSSQRSWLKFRLFLRKCLHIFIPWKQVEILFCVEKEKIVEKIALPSKTVCKSNFLSHKAGMRPVVN